MKAEDLKNSILQLAMEGKLVPQNPNDEPASVLLEKIRDEKERLIKAKKIKRNNKESFIFRKNGHFYEKIGKKGEPICIDAEIPFEVPINWELCRLENLCSLLNPKIGENGKYPYLNAKFLRNKTDTEIKEKGRFIQTNTKVILVDGENSGEVFLTHEDGYMGSTFRLLDINSQIYDKYILKLIELWRNPLKKSKKGAAIPHLNKDIFNNIFVGIPPFNEQKRIVNQINSLMPLINEYGNYKEKLDKLNSEFSDKLKSSILQEAIQGKLVPQNPNDEPASVLLERIRDEKERLIKEKKIKRNKNESYIFKENNHFYEKIGKEVVPIDNELPFEIPNTWMWCKLENITFNVHYGYTASAQETGDVKLLRITDIDRNYVNWDSVPYCLINEDKLTNYILKNRDIVMARTGGTIGKSYIINNLNEKAVFASYLIRIIPLKNINEHYLKQFFESPLFWSQLKNNTKGTGQPNVNAKSLKGLLIPIPPTIEQDKIVIKIGKIFQEIDSRLKV